MPVKKVRKKRNGGQQEGMSIKGFSRVQLVEDGRIVGDSGWCGPNQVTNLGRRDYLCHLLAASAGSLQISRMLLGTGTAPGAAATGLDGELDTNSVDYTRTTVSLNLDGSTRIDFRATFNSSDSHIAATTALQNIAIMNDVTTAGTIFAGNTYTVSTWQTNQDVNATYSILFST